MVTLEQAKEIVAFLEESLSNSYFSVNEDANINGYKCAINDIREKYINNVLNKLKKQDNLNDSSLFITKVVKEHDFAKSKKFDNIVIVIETSAGEFEISEYENGFINDNLDGVYSELDEIASDLYNIINTSGYLIEGLRIE